MNEAGNLSINCVFLHSHYRYYVPLRLPPIRRMISPSLYIFSLPLVTGRVSPVPNYTFHTYRSSIPKDSSVLLSSFFTRSMVFAHFAKAQLPFALFRDLFNDTADFTLCYGLHNCSHSLSELLYPLA